MEDSVLIVAGPERLREALRALLMAMPLLGVVASAGDVPSALRTIGERPPALVVLDSTLGADEVRRVLETIKAKAPHTRCLVLTGNTRQEQAARAAGADNILPKRFTTATLFAAIADLLPVPEA